MLLEIIHNTRYDYSAPVRESVMELWMQPRADANHRLVTWSLQTDPQARYFAYTDWLGNMVYHFDVPGAHDGLQIRAVSVVETRAPDPLPDIVAVDEWDRLNAEWVRERYFEFLNPSRFVEDTEHLSQFITDQQLEKGPDPLESLKRLNDLMYDVFDYTPGFTAADSPIDAALKHRKGVCQDFAHIMLAVARRWGVPARYVSGYLFHGAGARERSTPDATHAWVECFLPSLGWIGFDPTNDMMTSERHIAVAIGRDYADVPPTRGVYKGEATSVLSVAVQVHEARQAKASTDFLRMPRAKPPRSPDKKATSLALQMQQQQQQQQQQ
jgi:transglutaminase-like putative cysteine protease